tara:strand:+ start:6415 stop:6819 length:405 start_codon:yes stop_codon:yes gene_type:complete
MLSTIINIILLIALAIAALFVLQRMRGRAKPKHVPPVDPLSQSAYTKTNVPMEEEVSLTLQERIELSWQFLTNITEQVISRFSKKDQQQIYKAGQALTQNGTKYQHDVYQEANFTQKTVKTVQKDKDKSASKSR